MIPEVRTLPPSACGRVDRLESMTPSAIRQIHDHWQTLKRDEPTRSWIALHFGEPDLGTPSFIVQAGCDALRAGAVFYENNSGRPDLKEALTRYYEQHFGIVLSPDHFVITCGGTQAIMLTMLALLAPGDEVINLTPAWPNFTQAARIAGATVHELPLTFDTFQAVFSLDFDVLQEWVEQSSRVRMVIVNTPSNPTGFVMSAAQKERLATFCRDRELFLMADEIYDRIVFTDQQTPSFLHWKQPSDGLIVINGFSKTYCMTGWRVGYLVIDSALAAKMARMQEFITSHAPSMAQVAAITALRDGEPFIRKSLERYQQLRDLVVDRLRALPGATIARPDGSIYVFFSVAGLQDSVHFCRQLLVETGVVLAPGEAFGAGGGPWLRLCLAKKPDVLEDAIDRLKRFLEKRSEERGARNK